MISGWIQWEHLVISKTSRQEAMDVCLEAVEMFLSKEYPLELELRALLTSSAGNGCQAMVRLRYKKDVSLKECIALQSRSFLLVDHMLEKSDCYASLPTQYV